MIVRAHEHASVIGDLLLLHLLAREFIEQLIGRLRIALILVGCGPGWLWSWLALVLAGFVNEFSPWPRSLLALAVAGYSLGSFHA